MKETIRIEVNGYKEGNVVQAVTAALEAHFEDKVRELASKKLEAAIDKVCREMSRDAVAVAIKKALDEGWTRTNEYGEGRGPKITLKDRISEILTERDKYSSNRTWLETVVKEKIDEALKGDLGKDVAAAREKFRKMLDETVMASWLKTMKEALGVRS